MVCFANTNPLDGDFSDAIALSTFEQPYVGPGATYRTISPFPQPRIDRRGTMDQFYEYLISGFFFFLGGGGHKMDNRVPFKVDKQNQTRFTA